MIESLENIYNGYATVIKNKEYLSPRKYIEPFIEQLQNYTNNFICRVKPADQLTIDNEVELVYNKILITAVFPKEYDIISTRYGKQYNYHRVVIMTYGLDCKNPYCKFYTGVIDENMNFYAFGGDCIKMQKIEPDTALDYSCLPDLIEHGLSDNCQTMLDQFDHIFINQENLQALLGEWVDFALQKEYINDSGKVKLASNMAVNAYKSIMLDRESNFYSEDPEKSIHDLYCSWAEQITKDDKDFTNRYEKTQLINQMFKL